jgi:hypothetical protein
MQAELERQSKLEYNRSMMSMKAYFRRYCPSPRWGVVLAAGLLWAAVGLAQDNNSNQSPAQPDAQAAPQDQQAPTDKKDRNSSEPRTTKLRIVVTDGNDKPIASASVYVRYNVSGGFLRQDKLAELNFKTNQDGTVKVPEIPQGKILIQVIAKGWHTYGKWYDIDKDEESVPIKLEPPPHWY